MVIQTEKKLLKYRVHSIFTGDMPDFTRIQLNLAAKNIGINCYNLTHGHHGNSQYLQSIYVDKVLTWSIESKDLIQKHTTDKKVIEFGFPKYDLVK